MMEYKREIDMENEKSSLGNQEDNGIKRQRSRWVKLGFKPSCKCNADFEPGTVLDPFAGSGTVGVVAKKQGKNAILIEISPEYVEIIKNRLEIEASGINMNVKFVETASISSMEEEE
jgi:methylase of polypeptide subunit release factors